MLLTFFVPTFSCSDRDPDRCNEVALVMTHADWRPVRSATVHSNHSAGQ
jgi:hypothetical protein